MGLSPASSSFVGENDDNSIFCVKCIRDIGPLPSKMTSHREIAGFWRGNRIDFTAVAIADGTSFNVTGLPETLEYSLAVECPAELESHFTINSAQDLLYHGCERTALRKRRSLDDVVELPADVGPSNSTSSRCYPVSMHSKRRTSKRGGSDHQCRRKYSHKSCLQTSLLHNNNYMKNFFFERRKKKKKSGPYLPPILLYILGSKADERLRSGGYGRFQRRCCRA